VGRTAVTHPPLAKLDELWAKRPFPPHPLEKLDELGTERPFSSHHLNKLHELWGERPLSLNTAHTNSWRMASGAWLGLKTCHNSKMKTTPQQVVKLQAS